MEKGFILKGTGVFVLILFFCHSVRSESKGGLCAEGKWVGKPTSEKGHFVGSFAVECKLEAQSQPLHFLPLYFKKRIQTESSFISEEKVLQEKEISILQFTVKRRPPSEPTLELEEEVVIAQDGSFMATRSLHANGSGFNSYVRQIRFYVSLEFEEAERNLLLKSISTLDIERPWYSPAPLFYPMVQTQATHKLNEQINTWAQDIQRTIQNMGALSQSSPL